MNLLKYGMEHEKNGSKIQRIAAKCMLKLEMWRADRYEALLNRKKIPIPEEPEETAAMLQAIREQAARTEPGETDVHASG